MNKASLVHLPSITRVFGLLMILLSLSTWARAEDNLLLGQWSRHHKHGNLYNQTHGLVGYERNNFSVGHFTNSYNNSSWFVGYSQEYTPTSLPFIQFKLNYAAVTGYEEQTVLPMMFPSLTIGKGPIKVDISYIPLVATTVGFRISIPKLK